MNNVGRCTTVFLSILLAAGQLSGQSSTPLPAVTIPNAQKLPASMAGTISPPRGRIAFSRNKDVWVMDADGTNQTKVCEVKNAEGRMSWAPDGKRIAFSRQGQVSMQLPDGMGGQRKVYDLFIAFLDSAVSGNTFFWHRITTGLGGRDPEWSEDGQEIIFTNDLVSSRTDAGFPNYQVCTIDPEGGNYDILRKDWQSMSEYMMNPSRNKKGDIAFVHLYESKPQGLAIVPQSSFMRSMDSIKAQTQKMLHCVAPAWSPDGKWIAYVRNDMERAGVYIGTPDLKTSYLVYLAPPEFAPYTVSPSFSPDSKWLTFSTNDGSVWISDITGNNQKRLSGPGADRYPAWSKAPAK